VKSFIVIIVLAAKIANAQRAPVIVELFTSEGCSSCPPADNLLSRLPKALPDIDVIPLSEHVDYWNHLGWKDRFSSALYTERQQDYVRTFHLESPYTPEIVVNGQLQVSGSDERGVVQAIRKSAEGPRAATEMVLTSAGMMRITVGQIPEQVRGAEVFLAITESGLESSPNKGENSGARLQHIGVVRTLSSLTRMDTKRNPTYAVDTKLNPNAEWRRENLQYVVFVQDRASRRIIGAATLRPFANR
jgi:hypothetical protein